MGWRCLSDDRLLLWRRTIYLFHEFKSANWSGPFHRAGFRGRFPNRGSYIVGRKVLNHNAQELEPDIVTVGPRSWVVLDLTLFDDSKAEALAKYARIDPSSLGNHGVTGVQGSPIVFSVRLVPLDDGGFPQILVGDKLDFRNLELVGDPILRAELEGAAGSDLLNIPEIPVALLPESRPREIRLALIDIVMQLFSPARPTFSVNRIVEIGLERLSDCVSNDAKRDLGRKVDKEMLTLVRGSNALLGQDLERTDEGYRARGGVTWHPTTLERKKRALLTWASQAPTGKVLPLD